MRHDVNFTAEFTVSGDLGWLLRFSVADNRGLANGMAHVVTIHCLAMFATAESWWLTSCINRSHLGQAVYNCSATLGGNGYPALLLRTPPTATKAHRGPFEVL